MRVKYQTMLEAERLERYDNSIDVKELLQFMRKGEILDVGCGTGRIIEDLSIKLKDSKLYGIDIEPYFIKKAKEKNIQNAKFVVSSATKKLFKSCFFDIVIFRDSLHEIRESVGEKGVLSSLKNAFYYLKKGGLLIIRDGLIPSDGIVRFFLRSEEINKIFNKFIKHTGKAFKKNNGQISMNSRDFIHFLSKINKIRKGCGSLQESKHYTLSEYTSLLKEVGFKKIEVKKYKFPDLKYADILVNKKRIHYSYVMLVGQK